MVFVDESPMAVASSRLNVETNMPEALDRCRVYDQQRAFRRGAFPFNAVLCNPPFHQQHALTDNVARDVPPRPPLPENQRRAVYRCQPSPDYFHKLKKIFGNCTTIATNNKFVVLESSEAGASSVRLVTCRMRRKRLIRHTFSTLPQSDKTRQASHPAMSAQFWNRASIKQKNPCHHPLHSLV